MSIWQGLTTWVFPHAALLPIWIQLSWAMVVFALALRFANSFKVAAVLGLVMLVPHGWMPDVFAPSGYLALAFQTPSLVAFVWAILYSGQSFARLKKGTDYKPMTTLDLPTWLFAIGVLFGWALVLDTLNLWPSWFNPQLYALGFGVQAFWFVLLISAAVLWSVAKAKSSLLTTTVAALSVCAIYALLRLPTGNVWDALLDPFVWMALHLQLWRRLSKR